MRIRIAAVLGFALLTGLMADPARAITITLNADDYAVGTNLTEAIPGVKMYDFLSEYPRDPTGIVRFLPPVVTRSDAIADAGIFGFGAGLDWYQECLNLGEQATACGFFSGYPALEIVFDSPTSFVQASISYFADGAAIMAFDSNGNLVDYCQGWSGFTSNARCGENSSHVFGSHDVTVLSLFRSQADIARVLLGGRDAFGWVTQVSYDYESRSVPEPGTLALLGLGLAGLGFSKRRKLN